MIKEAKISLTNLKISNQKAVKVLKDLLTLEQHHTSSDLN